MFDWRRHKKWGFAILALALPLLFLSWEHYQGRRALTQWKQQLASRGEKLSIDENVPARSQGSGNNQFPALTALSRVPDSLQLTRIAPPAFQFQSPGVVFTLNTNPWTTLRTELAGWSNSLSQARQLLHAPVLEPNLNFAAGYSMPVTQLAPVRTLAQHLKLSALLDIHDGHGAEACGKLQDMLQVARILQNQPLLFVQGIRHTIIDGALQATWQLLQSPSNSETDLAELQRAFESLEFITPQIKALEMERAMTSELYRLMGDSVLFTDDMLRSFGHISTPPPAGTLPSTGAVADEMAEFVGGHGGQMLRRGVYVPTWQFAWAHQEELVYLQSMQLLLDALRGFARDGSVASLRPATQEFTKRVRGAGGALEHWQRLLLSDLASGAEQSVKRAVNATMERELVVTALALHRHYLRHGNYPASLGELIPQFTAAPPRDPWDGKPLRYSLDSANSPPALARRATEGPLLYSVGSNGQDDGGDATPSDEFNAKLFFLEGRDVVWPRPATNGTAARKAVGLPRM